MKTTEEEIRMVVRLKSDPEKIVWFLVTKLYALLIQQVLDSKLDNQSNNQTRCV